MSENQDIVSFGKDPFAGDSKQSSPSGSVVWFISFGDLLTLLVCFFLVLTPWDKLNKVASSQSIQTVTTSNSSMGNGGINLASTLLRHENSGAGQDDRFELLAEIPVFRSQVLPPSLQGLSSLTESISDELKMMSGTPTTITIRLCDESVSLEEVAMTVGRFVEAAKVPGIDISVEYPTASCERANIMRPVTEPLIGTVTVMGLVIPDKATVHG